MATKKIIIVMVLIGQMITVGCDKYEVTEREYSRVRTLPVTFLTQVQVTFNAEIFYPGDHEITEYGFVWSENSNLSVEYSNTVVLDEPITQGKYSTKVNAAFNLGTMYYVRAYARSDKYLVYGEMISFTP